MDFHFKEPRQKNSSASVGVTSNQSSLHRVAPSSPNIPPESIIIIQDSKNNDHLKKLAKFTSPLINERFKHKKEQDLNHEEKALVVR